MTFLFLIREEDAESAAGVITRRDNIINKQEKLFGVIQRLSSDAARLHGTLLLFKTNCDDVSLIHTAVL